MQPPADPSEPFSSARSRPAEADHSLWIAALYGELRALAQSELGAERAGHTLSATALVNEVYLKFSRQADGQPPRHGVIPPLDRGTFFGLAAQAMRRILIDHARSRRREKRGGGKPVEGGESLRGIADPDNGVAMDAVALDEALTRLAVENEQAARVVELRFFAGLPERTIADCLGLNERTVRRHWTFAKAWLAREMSPESGGGTGLR